MSGAPTHVLAQLVQYCLDGAESFVFSSLGKPYQLAFAEGRPGLTRDVEMKRALHAAEIIGKTQAEQLQDLGKLLGEALFQRLRRGAWNQFSFKAAPINSDGLLAPLALFSVWDELIQALRQAAKRLGMMPVDSNRGPGRYGN